jgi:hypothetical protein
MNCGGEVGLANKPAIAMLHFTSVDQTVGPLGRVGRCIARGTSRRASCCGERGVAGSGDGLFMCQRAGAERR